MLAIFFGVGSLPVQYRPFIFGLFILVGNYHIGISGPFTFEEKKYDIQFFGDLYISERTLKITGTTLENKNVFSGIGGVFSRAKINVVNFEGAVSSLKEPYVEKKYLLHMPDTVLPILKHSGVHGVTLANNHSLDFGIEGLKETISGIENMGIQHTGAGNNFAEATRPMAFKVSGQSHCVFSFSKTFPESFWAGPTKPGTANPSLEQAVELIEKAKSSCSKIYAVYHWGAEGYEVQKPYQERIAKKLIDVGASAVLGHHPHTVQDIALYKDKPIIYSLGNFSFSSLPIDSRPSGISVGFSYEGNRLDKLIFIPYNVDNRKTGFKIRPFAEGEFSPNYLETKIKFSKKCMKLKKPYIKWICQL